MDKTIGQIKSIREKYAELVDKLKAEISQCISECIKQNPNIKPLGNGSIQCFSISSTSVMTGAKILSPFYYDFIAQRNFLLALVNEKLNPETILNTLSDICLTGRCRHKNETLTFHPEVVKRLSTFIAAPEA